MPVFQALLVVYSTIPVVSVKIDELPGFFMVPELLRVVTVKVFPAILRIPALLSVFTLSAAVAVPPASRVNM